MVHVDLLLIHGFWSSPETWDRLICRLVEDPDLEAMRIHAFGYESPKFPRWSWSPTRIPDYNDIAQSLPAYLAARAPGDTPLIVVTHSQGGLILQRFLAWMLAEGRGRELARIHAIVMLACPNEGSEYLSSIRAVTGLNRHPQAGQLEVLAREVGDARRIVLRQIVHATAVDDRQCPVPVYVYAGRTDNIVTRQSAQGVFPTAEVLPGDHFTIHDPDTPGSLIFPTLKRLIVMAAARPASSTATPPIVTSSGLAAGASPSHVFATQAPPFGECFLSAMFDDAGTMFSDRVGRPTDTAVQQVTFADGGLTLRAVLRTGNAGVDLNVTVHAPYIATLRYAVEPGSRVMFDLGLRWAVPGKLAYLLRTDTTRNTVALLLFKDGQLTPLAEPTSVEGLSSGRDVSLTVAVEETQLKLWVDGVRVVDASDNHVPETAGTVPGLDVFGNPGSGAVTVRDLSYYNYNTDD